MLTIFFGYDEDAILSVDTYFNNTYEDEWFLHPFVRKIVSVVDGSEVRDRQLIVSPVLGQIPPERLSGGAKALIHFTLIYFIPKIIANFPITIYI